MRASTLSVTAGDSTPGSASASAFSPHLHLHLHVTVVASHPSSTSSATWCQVTSFLPSMKATISSPQIDRPTATTTASGTIASTARLFFRPSSCPSGPSSPRPASPPPLPATTARPPLVPPPPTPARPSSIQGLTHRGSAPGGPCSEVEPPPPPTTGPPGATSGHLVHVHVAHL